MNRAASSFALLVLRFGLACVFLYHGGQKVFGWFGGSGNSETRRAPRRCSVRCVFAALRSGGNALAVVPDADWKAGSMWTLTSSR